MTPPIATSRLRIPASPGLRAAQHAIAGHAAHLVVAALLFNGAPAYAHSVWIEADAQGARLLYGEPEVALKERSPGKLDHIDVTRAEALGSQGIKSLTPRREATGVVLEAGTAGSTLLATAQSKPQAMPGDPPGAAAEAPSWLYYARHMAWPIRAALTAPALTLDIVPMPGQANTFTVFFKGEPLREGTLKVMAPSLWIQIHDIDTAGRVHIRTPWRGRYVLDVEHAEPKSAEGHAGPTHRASLSFVQPTGIVFRQPLPPQFKVH